MAINEGITFKLTGDVALFAGFLDRAKMNSTLERNLKKATLKNCLYLVARIKQQIKTGNFEANQPLTLALSKGTKPLLKEKNLLDAVNYKLKNSFSAVVGFIGDQQSTGGVTGQTINVKKLVELMHQNYTIQVTPSMIAAIMNALNDQKTKRGNLTGKARAAIKALQETEGGGGARVFRVKARPFFNQALEGEDVNNMLQYNWTKALEDTFLERGAKGGDHKNK